MTDRVRGACESCFEAHKNDCSGFVRAVGAAPGVEIEGLADDIVDALRHDRAWRTLPDGVAAAASALAGNLVVAGLRGNEQFHPNVHGHVVVIVSGPLARERYPSAYWGSLGGVPAKFETINFAWTEQDRNCVAYAEQPLPAVAGSGGQP
jgi:hypothetical protein